MFFAGGGGKERLRKKLVGSGRPETGSASRWGGERAQSELREREKAALDGSDK